MNPSTKLFLDEMRRLFAEQNAWLDRLFAEHNAPAPSAVAGVAPAPSAAASVAPAPSATASVVPVAAPSAPSTAASITIVSTSSTTAASVVTAPAPSTTACITLRAISLELATPPHLTNSNQHEGIHFPRVLCAGPDDNERPGNDLAPPRRATATRLHIVRPNVVPKALRWFIADPGVTFVGLGSAHDDHTQEEHYDSAAPSLSSADATVFDEQVHRMLRECRAELSVPTPASYLLQMVMPKEEDEVPSTLPNRCLMNCLTIIQRCFSLPFSCSWDAVLCWQHRPWPPPLELRLVSYEAELRPLPWPSFDMVERYSVTSLFGRLWKPPWYVSTQQQISCLLAALVESWKCLMRPGRIVVIPVPLGICLLDSEVMTASILSKLKLVHHGSCSDKGVSRVHILVHYSIAYQSWRLYQMAICWISGATKTYLKMSEHMARVGIVCSPCYVDVVDFGKSDDEKPEKLESFVAAVVHSSGSSIPLAQYLVDKSIQSCFLPSWGAVPHGQAWPPPMQFEIQSDGVQLRPMPWSSFGCLTVRCHTCFLHKVSDVVSLF